MAFGSAIRKLREDAGISVDKLTEKIGVKAGRWRKWEEKDFDPRDEDQARIEAFFGMSLSEIVMLPDIKKFLKVPNEEQRAPQAQEAPVDELTTAQIMSLLAKANDKYAETLAIQARILERIESKMAKEQTLLDLETNYLKRTLAAALTVAKGQEDAMKELCVLLKKEQAQRIDPSQDSDKGRRRTDGGFEKKGKNPA